MSENTKIEWADHSWSPWRGCTKVSPGCVNCYAETLSKRNPAVLGEWGKGKPRVLAKNWNDPVKWNRREESKLVGHAEFVSPTRPRVFPSLCDWLDDEVPTEWLARFLRLIHETPHIDWLLLTKRPENFTPRMYAAFRWMTSDATPAMRNNWARVANWLCAWAVAYREIPSGEMPEPPANVWLGVSVEDQERADERVPLLLDIPARIRWLSVEPLLSYVDLTHIDAEAAGHDKFSQIDALTGRQTDMGRPCPSVPHVDWVVIGGESGAGARSCDISWIGSLVEQGKRASVPVFVKQLGSRPEIPTPIENVKDRWPVRHRKGGDRSEWPDALRVREFPKEKGQP